MLRNWIFIFACVLAIFGCVPAKKYYEVEKGYTKYKEKSTQDSIAVEKMRTVNGDLLMRVMNLSKDSISTHKYLDSLSFELNEMSVSGSQQIASIRQELDNKSVEIQQKEAQRKLILNSIKSFDVEINSLYRRLDRALTRYKGAGVDVNVGAWSVIVSLPDEAIFAGEDYKELSDAGKSIVSIVTRLATEHTDTRTEIVEFSQPRVEEVVYDSVATYTTKEVLLHTIPVVDSVVNGEAIMKDKEIEIEYDVEKFNIEKKYKYVDINPGMDKGAAISNFINSMSGINHNTFNFSGTVVTNSIQRARYQGLRSGRVEIIISPKISSLLREMGNF